jgi:hypothetical protein
VVSLVGYPIAVEWVQILSLILLYDMSRKLQVQFASAVMKRTGENDFSNYPPSKKFQQIV